MCEDYNSPQSPYWSLKTLIAVGLTENSEFWESEEQDYPAFVPITEVPVSQQLIFNPPGGNHHFLLSASLFVAWPMKAAQAKYCKFAYSSSFAFSVPTGPLIQQIAPDSTLALSRDGAETWAVKWKCGEATFSTAQVAVASQDAVVHPTAAVQWSPWGDGAVSVVTTLVGPTERWPDWHVRIHHVQIHQPIPSLHMVEGGFAISWRKRDPSLMSVGVDDISDGKGFRTAQFVVQSPRAVLVVSSAGASGIIANKLIRSGATTSCRPLTPDSNTNLAHQRTLIPVVEHSVAAGLQAGDGLVLVEKVFAISATANGGWKNTGNDLKGRWEDVPVVRIGHQGAVGDEDCIVVPV